MRARRHRLVLAAMTVTAALGLAGLGILAMPAGGGGPLAAWCRPAGQLDLLRALVVVSPLAASAVLGALGWRTIRSMPAESWLRHGIAVASLTGVLAVVLVVTAASWVRSVRLPAVTLVDQDGAPFAFADLRGAPAVVGTFYTRCSTACPMAFAELKLLRATLTPAERSSLYVVMITLDPAHDTPERLRELAAGHGLTSPCARLLTGSPPLVERVLDELDVARRRDAATGVIEHRAELLLVAPDGRVTARYGGGPEAERALFAALRSMLAR